MSSELLMTSLAILFRGLLATLLLSAAAIVGGTLIGLLAAVLVRSGRGARRPVARLYTELFRARRCSSR